MLSFDLFQPLHNYWKILTHSIIRGLIHNGLVWPILLLLENTHSFKCRVIGSQSPVVYSNLSVTTESFSAHSNAVGSLVYSLLWPYPIPVSVRGKNKHTHSNAKSVEISPLRSVPMPLLLPVNPGSSTCCTVIGLQSLTACSNLCITTGKPCLSETSFLPGHAHVSFFSNPHKVTKSPVFLDSVPFH